MNEPTAKQYASFGSSVAGLMDGYTYNSTGDRTIDNAALVLGIEMFANIYGIEFEDRTTKSE